VIVDTVKEERDPEPLKYYVDATKTPHIDRWEYSPACATRLVETVF
jgi:hypothetical protein